MPAERAGVTDRAAKQRSEQAPPQKLVEFRSTFVPRQSVVSKLKGL